MFRFALLATTTLVPCAALAQDALVLETVTVQGASYETEGSGSYATDLISVGEKEAIDPRKIAQTTTVVTHKRIQDADYTSLDTAMQKTPGMLVLNNDAGRSSLYARGFELDYLYYDGLPAPLSSIYGTQPDLSIIDHVEILKGPSGLFIGTGEPAGSVNMRLKQAGAVAGGSLEFSANSFGRARVQADVTGPLNADGTLRGRAIVAREAGKGAVDKQRNGVTSGYATLAYDLTPDTTLTLSASSMSRDIDPFNGLPTYADGRLLDLGPSTTTAADWNHFDNSVTDVLAAVEHRLDNGGFVKLGARWSQREAEFLYAFAGTPAAADNTIGRLAWLGRRFDEESLALDAFASLPFSVAGGGNLIVGMDYQKVSARTDTARGAIAGRFDLANWDVSGVSRPEVNYSQSQTDDVTRRGLYSQLRLTPLEGLNLIGGARLSWYESSASDGLSGAALSAQKIDAKLTPYLGLTYDLNDSLTVYASHTAMFQPQTALGADGRPIAPREGRQTEFGLKGALDGLTLTAALFDLRDKNRARQLPGETAFTASEAVRVRGLELEASGQVAPDWQLAAGYVWTQTEYLNGPASGAAFSTYTPKHLFKLWAEYDPDTGALAPWSFGLGVTAMSSFSSSVRGVTVNAPGYATFDASLGYAIDERTDLRLNVSNLFDREYYTRVGSTSVFNFYGEPRNATLKLVRRF